MPEVEVFTKRPQQFLFKFSPRLTPGQIESLQRELASGQLFTVARLEPEILIVNFDTIADIDGSRTLIQDQLQSAILKVVPGAKLQDHKRGGGRW